MFSHGKNTYFANYNKCITFDFTLRVNYAFADNMHFNRDVPGKIR